ncbi:MAG: TolC family protein, partial [Deltaproteobacteria bacterium]|nr:TolC family protein [Deltaproteobacteria bacterium]
ATVTVPIFSLNGGAIAVAEAERRHQRELRERLAIATAREVTAAVAQVEATGARAQELRLALAPLDQEIDALLAEPQTAVATDPVKLLLLDERRVIAHRALIDASYAHRAAQIALEALIGGPL